MISKQMESTAVGIAGTIQPSALLQGEMVVPKVIEGSGEGTTTSDWNAKEGERGYILNRTHWSEGESTVEVFPVADLLFSENEGAALSSTVVEGLVNGDEVVVTYNGVEYNCIVVEKSMDGLPVRVVGDADVMESGPSGTYPFMAMFLDAGTAAAGANGVGTYVLPLDGATSVSFGIKKTTENIRKLDNKYLDLAWLPTAKVTLTAVMSEITVDTTSRVPVLVRDLPIEALPVGTKVIVTFDGVEYKCNIIGEGGTRCFGNPFLLGNPTSTGEPFFFLNEENRWWIWTSERASHTVAIAEEKRVYNKIPEEFLGKTANWSQNDPNGIGYIENRTHWSEGTEVDILPECELFARNPENLDGWFDVDKEMGEIIAGKTYTVTRNGTDYTLIAQEIVTEGELCCALGDIGLWDDAPTGDLPFLLICLPRDYALETGLYALFVDSNCPASVTIQVRGEIEVINHINSKYIEDMYGWEQDATLVPFVELSDIPDHGRKCVPDLDGKIGQVFPKIGAEYKVVYNDTLYICTAKMSPQTPSMGNFVSMLGNGRYYGEDDTGEPFLVLFGKQPPSPGITNIDVDVLDGSKWASLFIKGPGVKKVPGEYLPNFVNPSVYANDIGWLQEQVDTNKSNVSDLFSNVNDLNSNVFSLMSRINSVENTNRTQNADISALQQKVDATAVDWDAKEDEPGHILNRTHWSEGVTEVDIFPATTLPYSEMHEGFANIGMGIGLVEGISVGDTAIVSYNGVEYTCDVEEFTSDGVVLGVIMGDTAPMRGEAPSGEYPFVLMIPNLQGVQEAGANLVVMDPTGRTDPVTVSIKKSVEIIHKLDNKYLDLDWVPKAESKSDEVFSGTINVPGAGIVTLPSVTGEKILAATKAIVTFDGVEYKHDIKLVVIDGITTAYIGNHGRIDQGKEDTGEPFFIAAASAEGRTECAVNADKGEHDIKIVTYLEIFSKIPEEFLDKDAIVSAVISALPKYNGEVVEV